MKWSERITISRPLPEVKQAIVDAEELLAWSAWPEATGYSCRIDGDGRSVGSQIVFTDPHGVVQGRQVLETVRDDVVDFRLHNRGPGGREMHPHLRFRLVDLDGSHTQVHLDFEAEAPLPFGARHVVEAIMGRRVRALHVKDLEQLKAHVENGIGRS
ncbi:SRPBCC family protein [Mycolicibacterium iranicum]|uniref:Polyketide cyclase n=1 Tax=Mycolicibacterium iranicum TaxID=912594 RepID=A0A178LMW1_MYCIR|nr:SRPBCC family protein [Mycolicibacterium iranicum]OAN32492.1 hypothetical protein A4X20_08165 [Mycolicibacterium iranicum]